MENIQIEYNYQKNLIKKQFNIKKTNFEKIKKLAKKHKKSMSWIVDMYMDKI